MKDKLQVDADFLQFGLVFIKKNQKFMNKKASKRSVPFTTLY